jgi:hypothetical protein
VIAAAVDSSRFPLAAYCVVFQPVLTAYCWFCFAAFKNGGAKYIEYTKEDIETRSRMIPLGIVR